MTSFPSLKHDKSTELDSATEKAENDEPDVPDVLKIRDFIRLANSRTRQPRKKRKIATEEGQESSAVEDAALHTAVGDPQALSLDDLLADDVIAEAETLPESTVQSADWPSMSTSGTCHVRWTVEDTERFFNAIGTYGTDLTIIAAALGIQRALVSRKFKQEVRKNPTRMAALLEATTRVCRDEDVLIVQDGATAVDIAPVPRALVPPLSSAAATALGSTDAGALASLLQLDDGACEDDPDAWNELIPSLADAGNDVDADLTDEGNDEVNEIDADLTDDAADEFT